MTSTADDLKAVQEELKWIHMRETNSESYLEKSTSKFLTNPLVPLGCLVTAGILGRGLYYCSKRDSLMQQRYMRYRVLAQGITLALACSSLLFNSSK